MKNVKMQVWLGIVCFGVFTATASAQEAQDTNSCWENETAGAECREETTGMEFVYVPGGCFQMGINNGEDRAKPMHQVCLEGFWMGRYEVTQAQWETVMGNNPASFKGANRPIESITWKDTQEFLRKLNAHRNSRSLEDSGSLEFRLPSEAQWEYAARAGSQTAYSFGDNESVLGEYAWYRANSGDETHPVGQKKPNDFGLYDLHGNVWEWCADTWFGNYVVAPNDGSARGSLDDGKAKVVRGGSWGDVPYNLRSANRFHNTPDDRSNYIGGRVAASRTR